MQIFVRYASVAIVAALAAACSQAESRPSAEPTSPSVEAVELRPAENALLIALHEHSHQPAQFVVLQPEPVFVGFDSGNPLDF